jgi:hypothetical protein
MPAAISWTIGIIRACLQVIIAPRENLLNVLLSRAAVREGKHVLLTYRLIRRLKSSALPDCDAVSHPSIPYHMPTAARYIPASAMRRGIAPLMSAAAHFLRIPGYLLLRGHLRSLATHKPIANTGASRTQRHNS